MADNDSIGHRSRLLSRFARGGIAALHNYEILELALSFIIPRRDTKPLAKALLERFKTVHAVLAASQEELCAIDGIGPRAAQFISFVKSISAYCLQEASVARPVLTGLVDVERHLRFTFGHEQNEFVAAVFVDSGNRIITTEILARGTVNQCVVYPRSVVSRAMAVGAAGVILAHNHPGGTTKPSEADWDLTIKLQKAAALLEVRLLDHLLICDNTAISMRELPRWQSTAGIV